MKSAIITGITGQDGSYLAKLLLEKEYRVIGIVRSLHSANLNNLRYLGIHENVEIVECDLTDLAFVIRIIEQFSPNELYNLAAQSSVGLSFSNPISTIQFNISSVYNLLEAIRLINKSIRFYQASSSEMFGKVDKLPITLSTPMHPLSPYATSKASAHWLVINYREGFNLFACNGILFNHESFLRPKNFFVKKVIFESVQIHFGLKSQLRVGNLDVKRDFGYAPKYVEAMWSMLQQKNPNDFIICSGKSVYLKEIVAYVFDKLEIPTSKITVDPSLFRPVDIIDIYGDKSPAENSLNWTYNLDFNEVLDGLIADEIKNHKASL